MSRILSLTVYQSGPAVIREERSIQLQEGINTIQLSDLPTSYIANSIVYLSAAVASGGVKYRSASYLPPNLSLAEILRRSIGSAITLFPHGEEPISGLLQAVLDGNHLLISCNTKNNVVPLTPRYELQDALPPGLSQTSYLVLELERLGDNIEGEIRFLYEANNISWKARYNAFLDQKTGTFKRLECLVDVTNQAGFNIEAGAFSLLPGANFTGGGQQAKGGIMAFSARSMSLSSMAPDEPLVESLGEHKLYVLPEPLSVNDSQTKHGHLFSAADVPLQKTELFLPAYDYSQLQVVSQDDSGVKLPVSVSLSIDNDSESNLGKDLPPGELALFIYDESGAEQKVDTAPVEARAKGETIKLVLRKPSADVKATRRLSFVHEDTPETSKRTIKQLFREEERVIKISNYKDVDVEVLIYEQFPKGCEFLTTVGHEAATLNSSTNGTFRLSVPAKDEASVTYRIKFAVEQ